MPLGVYYIQPSLHLCGDAMGKGVIYTCIGVGLSTLLVSTNWGNAKAFTSWNGQQGSAPRLFYCLISPFGAGGRGNITYYDANIMSRL